MVRPGADSEKKDDKRYSFDFVVGHKMKRGQPVFTVRWSHPWNSAEHDSELITTNMSDRAGTLAEYMKRHGLVLKKTAQRKKTTKGKVAKKQVQKKVQKKEQKKKEVKKKPSWYWEEVSDDGEEETEADQVEEEEEEEDSLPDVNQRQPAVPLPVPLPVQVAQVAPVAAAVPVSSAAVAQPVAPPPAPPVTPVAAHRIPSALQDVLQAQADARASCGVRFPQATDARPPPAASQVAPQVVRRVDRMMAETACARGPPAPPAAPANNDDDLIYLSDG